jgi:hypothetical protein
LFFSQQHNQRRRRRQFATVTLFTTIEPKIKGDDNWCHRLLHYNKTIEESNGNCYRHFFRYKITKEEGDGRSYRRLFRYNRMKKKVMATIAITCFATTK